MPSGKVKWFNSKKGYGFITDNKTKKDIFLHVSALESSKLRVLKSPVSLLYLLISILDFNKFVRKAGLLIWDALKIKSYTLKFFFQVVVKLSTP